MPAVASSRVLTVHGAQSPSWWGSASLMRQRTQVISLPYVPAFPRLMPTLFSMRSKLLLSAALAGAAYLLAGCGGGETVTVTVTETETVTKTVTTTPSLGTSA